MTQVVDLRLVPAAGTSWVLVYLLVGQEYQNVLRVAGGLALGLVVVVMLALRKVTLSSRGCQPDTPADFGRGAEAASTLGLRFKPQGGYGQIIFVLSVLVAAAVTTTAHLHTRSSEVLEHSAANGSEVEVLAKVTSDARLVASWGEKQQFLMTLTTLTVRDVESGVAQHVQSHLVLFADDSWEHVRFGATIRARGHVVAGGDSGAREQFQLSQPAPPILVASPNAFLAKFETARMGLVQAAHHLPEPAMGLVPGIGVGDRTHVSTDLAKAMRVTGLTHITAVSGSHFAIVAAAAMGVTTLMRLPRLAKVLVSAVVMGAFVVLVRPEPSVVRAALMGTFVLAGVSLGRPARALSALSAAVIFLLLADPWLARSYGFILSVLATGGLVLWAGPLTRYLSRWLPQWLALVIAIPAVAQAVCGPVVILLEPNFATYAIAANVLATPALPPAALCSVLAAAFSTFWPAGAALLATCAGWASAWIAGVAMFFAGLPGAYPPWPAGISGALLLAALSGAVVLLLFVIPYARHVICLAIHTRRYPWLRSGPSPSEQRWDS